MKLNDSIYIKNIKIVNLAVTYSLWLPFLFYVAFSDAAVLRSGFEPENFKPGGKDIEKL